MEKYEGNDIYCDQIIPGTLKVDTVRESDRVLAFRPAKPAWRVHVVVVPKVHVDSLLELLPDSVW